MLLVGTTEGLFEVGGAEPKVVLPRPVTCLAAAGAGAGGGRRWWALADGRDVLASDDGGASWDEVASVDAGLEAHCLAAAGDGRDGVLVGTSEAHVLRLDGGAGGGGGGGGGGRSAFTPDASFDAIPTRDQWYTPWGGPPDTRSLAADGRATFVNVHVGGVWRSAGDGWEEKIEVDADTHQVAVAGGRVLVAAAVGFAESTDGGETFEWSTDGLHATYARAVALAGDTVLLTASTGPWTKEAAVYRRDVEGGPFRKAHDGLPEWFTTNIDTFCLAASGPTAAFGTGDGEVHVSTDAGRSWEQAASGLPPVRCVLLT